MSRVRVMDGNMAAAYGALLCRPTVLAAYPITPQTPLVEYLSTFIADGDLRAEMVQVESEHSALSVLHGACPCGRIDNEDREAGDARSSAKIWL